MGSIDSISSSKTSDVVKQRIHPWYEPVKRILDIAVSSVILTISLPILIPLSLAIVIDSPGTVLYKRRVVGRNGKQFDALKLRTMVANSDDKILSDEKLNEEYNNNHKLRSDPRITRLGNILRRTSIDELPQLINVIRGEMSLVGPRMISFPELEKFGPWQEKILEVKPGITGMWQVSGRSNLDYSDRVRLNVYYIDNRSILLDLKILAKTIPAVLSTKGAY
ncbi:MAG: sugar transferase [Armatimonadota bacterium]